MAAPARRGRSATRAAAAWQPPHDARALAANPPVRRPLLAGGALGEPDPAHTPAAARGPARALWRAARVGAARVDRGGGRDAGDRAQGIGFPGFVCVVCAR